MKKIICICTFGGCNKCRFETLTFYNCSQCNYSHMEHGWLVCDNNIVYNMYKISQLYNKEIKDVYKL